MTTLTGITEQKHAGTVDHTSFELAMFGAIMQLSTVLGVWATQTTAAGCLTDPLGCLGDLGAADPWGRQALLTLCFAGFMWALSVYRGSEEGTSDPSIVDRLWSINPLIYTAHFFWASGGMESENTRLSVMTALVTLWSTRLTWNFWRKGGFSGGEDYRWIEVRKWFPGWQFEVFNLVFVCFFQQCAILAFTTPAAYALQSSVPWNNIDTFATLLYALLVLGETVADNQMFNFQTEKYRRIKAGERLGPEYERGFIETGLWSWSRHPNYFCEVSVWWAFYLFTVGATDPAAVPEGSEWQRYVNWTVVGPFFLTLLFVPPGASLDVTESLSSRKYSAYPDYQAKVARFIPLPPGLFSSTPTAAATAAAAAAGSTPSKRKTAGRPRRASRSPSQNVSKRKTT